MTYEKIHRTCKNCDSFELTEPGIGKCNIRNLIILGERMPLPRKPNQKGCPVFMQKILNNPSSYE